jgi:hypothetical protein
MNPTTFSVPRKLEQFGSVLIALGVLAFAGGCWFEPDRAWAGLFMASQYLLGLGLAGALIVALQYVTGAGWAVALRRVPEAMTSLVWIGGVGTLLFLTFYSGLYPWTAGGDGMERTTSIQEMWLRQPFFQIRAVFYLTAWLILIQVLVRTSRRQDDEPSPRLTSSNIRWSGIFLVVYGITIWLATYDWIMSLEPSWSSTILPAYHFSGSFLSGLAVWTLVTIGLERLGPWRGVVTRDHLHDLGKLIFAFSTFWGYIWFCQYMLIWYVNIPEEAEHYVTRMEGAWQPLFYLNLVLNWMVPFLVLLPINMKRSRRVLVNTALVVLAGRWLDLFLAIMPAAAADAPVFGLVEIGLFLGTAGLAILVIFHTLAEAPLIPRHDPYLVESLHAADIEMRKTLAPDSAATCPGHGS